MNNPIILRPVEFSWSTEWLPRLRAWEAMVLRTMKEASYIGASNVVALAGMRAIQNWQTEMDAWLHSLSPRKMEDIEGLLLAECDLLWETIDPGHGPKPSNDYSDIVGDFRDRFFAAQPLALALSRINYSVRPLNRFHDLRNFAETKGWLP